MKTAKSLATLIAELDADAEELERIGVQNDRAWARINAGADDPIDWGALGFTLHHFYGVLENYFLRISKLFENTLGSDRWHKDLVDRMRLEIPGVRPAVLVEETDYREVVTLMRFRHRFRNLYGEDLDPVQTAAVQQGALRLRKRLPSIHTTFRDKLVSIAENLS